MRPVDLAPRAAPPPAQDFGTALDAIKDLPPSAVLALIKAIFGGDQLDPAQPGGTQDTGIVGPGDLPAPGGGGVSRRYGESLKTFPNGDIVTPGGFTIKPSVGQYAWSVIDPQGHCTEITGDPHVAVDDKHVFDFRRETSFLLPDGTRIRCNTKPLGNGMNVTTGLEIMAGQDHLSVTGIDQGKGKIQPMRPNQAGELAAYDGNEDALSYFDQNRHAGWDLVRGGGQNGGGEVVGDEKGGEILKTTGQYLKYLPEEGELGPCADERHQPPVMVRAGDPPAAPVGGVNLLDNQPFGGLQPLPNEDRTSMEKFFRLLDEADRLLRALDFRRPVNVNG